MREDPTFVGPYWRGRCPHCQTMVKLELPKPWSVDIESHVEPGQPGGGTSLHIGQCPHCKGVVIDLVSWEHDGFTPRGEETVTGWRRLAPAPDDPGLTKEVPAEIREAYEEAQRCRPISTTAAAALARRCLQLALHSQGFKARSLNDEIALASRDSRSTSLLIEKLEIVRNVGNYAAHPIVDMNAGVILEVEPGEVDALLDALRELFDTFWRKPALHQAMKAAVNAKLQAAGKKLIP